MGLHPMGRPSAFRLTLDLLKETVRKFFADNGPLLASALAFDLLLYSIPLSLLLISALGYALVGSDRALSEVSAVVARWLPTTHRDFMRNLSHIVANRGPLGLAGFVLFFVFSSAVFGTVRAILNRVFEVQRPRSFLKGKGRDFLVMLVAAALLIVTFGTSWVLTFLREFAERFPVLAPLLQPGWVVVSRLLGFLSTMALLYVLYRFCPARRIRRDALLLASLVGTVLFEISKWVFTWYVGFAQANVALYGALGGFLFFFLWLYYASAVLIVGAEVGWSYEQGRGTRFP